jgi:hypothetical protein
MSRNRIVLGARLAVMAGLFALGGLLGAGFSTPLWGNHPGDCGWMCGGTNCHPTSLDRTCQHLSSFICESGVCPP